MRRFTLNAISAPWAQVALAVASAALPSCGDKEPVDSGAASFAAVDAEILFPSCGFETCHGSGAGGLTLDGEGDHARLVGVAAVGSPGEVLVVPGDAQASYLVKKLSGAEGIVGDAMPPPNGGLSVESIARVRAWIDAGALDD